ncbi:MAG TPA: hypothetical protein VGY66_18035 [Gemmataceae bacterium]|jgi:hypothetical protein|nr:hypothetical protein [Gemmataceae bacterium]
MGKLLKRWYVWLGLVLLLGLAGSVALISFSQSRVTQANFDRIQEGMSLEEVKAILGEEKGGDVPSSFAAWLIGSHCWEHGPNRIDVRFLNDSAIEKHLHLATAWETLEWYAKKGAAKIGVKWD